MGCNKQHESNFCALTERLIISKQSHNQEKFRRFLKNHKIICFAVLDGKLISFLWRVRRLSLFVFYPSTYLSSIAPNGHNAFNPIHYICLYVMMAQHITKHAPKGTDTNVWKY